MTVKGKQTPTKGRGDASSKPLPADILHITAMIACCALMALGAILI